MEEKDDYNYKEDMGKPLYPIQSKVWTLVDGRITQCIIIGFRYNSYTEGWDYALITSYAQLWDGYYVKGNKEVRAKEGIHGPQTGWTGHYEIRKNRDILIKYLCVPLGEDEPDEVMNYTEPL